MSCVVNYYGLMPPGFQWYLGTVNILSVTNSSGSVNSTVQVTVTSNAVQQYRCNVSFHGSVFPYSATIDVTPCGK